MDSLSERRRALLFLAFATILWGTSSVLILSGEFDEEGTGAKNVNYSAKIHAQGMDAAHGFGC